MSTRPTTAEAFADAAAALVAEPDVADVLHHLVTDCAHLLDADAVAILARDAGGELSLLSATSHRVAELEMLQAQRTQGPCIDVLATSAALSLSGADHLRSRWPEVGPAIVDAGYAHVEAFPMRWRGVAVGGLNVFRQAPRSVATDPRAGQAFADVATIAVVHSVPVSVDEAAARVHAAIGARELVEQAKGVIAYTDDVDMSAAYDALIARAEASGQTLTQTARGVLQAQRRTPSPD
ncbi:ANTAR domain-containing protein [Nocardioides sp. URHA0020]|uniref:ANTAR domain-containing protein n=1 Tax=Nocardioides sp. URHA0020 TaxID=1380392 RepID=UPI00068784B0|nr:ANTAR domain-containing protein [Nocardioides sp. URHA0020]